MRHLSLIVFVLFVGGALTLHAQSNPPIPSPEQFLGYAIGERFTSHQQIIAYFEELARLTPRVQVTKFGETYEGRPLVYAVITSEKNQAATQAIRRDLHSLSDPGSISADRARQISESTPVVVWLAYGVHGNESSSSEASMMVAHALLTAPENQPLLDNTIVIIDPLQNPDGRERYIHNFQQRRGRNANPSPLALEHREPWAQGRYNHYLIDMNRDWAWISQRETLARIEAFQQWYPQVFVDLHEMSPESTYFFPPDARPVNANLPIDTEKWLEVFGRANGEAFSANRWPFFVGETYDLFYPGYGDSWPSFHGAIGMTFEMAGGGRAGTLYRRKDGDLLSLSDRVARHFTSSMATVRTASQHRSELLMHTYRALAAQLQQGKTTYVIPPDEVNASTVVELMQRHGVTVRRLAANTRLKAAVTSSGRPETRDFPAGSILISTAQPLGGFVQSLFERSPKFEESFLAEQRQKVSADEPTEFYDITAWAIPLAMNVHTWSVDGAVAGELLANPAQPKVNIPAAKLGYLIDPLQSDFYLFAGRLLQSGVKFSVSETELSGAEKTARGALLIEKARNSADLEARLARAAEGTAIRVRGVDSVWTEGPALGSSKIVFVRDPQIALVGGEGIEANSFGMLWHTLDVETETPHTVIPMSLLGSADLNQFHVVILPDTESNLVDRLGKNGVDSLRNWVRSGGTLIAIKGGAAALRAKEVEISKVKEWNTPKKEDEEKPDESRKNDFSVPGAAFSTAINERSYLTFGVVSPPAVLIEGSDALAPLARKGDNIVTISESEPLLSGFAFPESIERLKKAPYLTREELGAGSVITFADQPFYRLFWRATLPLLMNSVLYSPSFNDRD